MTGLLPPPPLTLWHLLDRATSVPDDLQDLVRAYVDDLLPEGAPSWCRRVLDVRTHAGLGFDAKVEIFDGGHVDFRCAGPVGAGCYSLVLPAGHERFYWHAKASTWRRTVRFFPVRRPYRPRPFYREVRGAVPKYP
jgi:hypothetical protein